MDKVLVLWSVNWADEMDLDGFIILEKNKWKEIVDKTNNIKNSIMIWIGTNQEIVYRNGEEALKTLRSVDVNGKESEILSRLLGEEYGQIRLIQELAEICNVDIWSDKTYD